MAGRRSIQLKPNGIIQNVSPAKGAGEEMFRAAYQDFGEILEQQSGKNDGNGEAFVLIKTPKGRTLSAHVDDEKRLGGFVCSHQLEAADIICSLPFLPSALVHNSHCLGLEYARTRASTRLFEWVTRAAAV